MEVRSNCRCCSAGCGIVAEVLDGRLTSVRGDVAHPLSRGYLCPKGHALAWSQNRPSRLDHPMIDGRQVSWPEMLDDLAAKIADLVRRHGGNAIGWYEGNGTATDNLGKQYVAALLSALGSTQDYSAATIDVAPVFRMAQLVAGSPMLLPRWVPEDPQSQLVIWVGGNPAVSHGYVTDLPDPVRRIKQFRARGGKLWVVDPRSTRTASIADHHLAIRPGTDHALLACLLREVIAVGALSADFVECTTTAQRGLIRSAVEPYTLAFTASATGLDEADLHALQSDLDRCRRLAVVGGTGLTFQRRAVENEWLRWTLLLATDSLDQPGGMWFNPMWFEPFDHVQEPLAEPVERLPRAKSRPDLPRVDGELPVTAMADEIRAGNLRALFVNGGNPVSSFPDPAVSLDALGRLELLIVADVAHSATTAIATHVLPVAAQMERMDLLLAAWATAVPAVVSPKAERRPTWWVAAHLGARLGFDLVDGADPDDLTDADLMRRVLAGGRQDAGDVIAAGSYGIKVPSPIRYLKDRVLPNGRWNILPDELVSRLELLGRTDLADDRLVFINGRQLSRNCSTGFVPPDRTKDRVAASINPADLADLGIRDGELVRLEGEDGVLEVEAQSNPSIARGAVWVPHGWLDHNVSQLTSLTRNVDPLTGQPVMTGLPVRLAKVIAGPVPGTSSPCREQGEMDLWQ